MTWYFYLPALLLILTATPFLIKRGLSFYRHYANTIQIDLTSLTQSVPIENFAESTSATDDVGRFWNKYTVRSAPFKTRKESLDYLAWRSSAYPLFPELMNLWGNHAGKVVLDYGCGPANDLVGFLEYSKAKQIIGADVSMAALKLASHRLGLHKEADLSRVRLLHLSDTDPVIPLPDKSVDYINSGGVLHHTNNPLAILKEFHRILKDGGEACIMVYHRDSLWMHYRVIYELKTLERYFKHLNIEESYARTTDERSCPIARCYRPEEFLAFTSAAGFRGEFRGAYFSLDELNLYKKHGMQPLKHPRLAEEHKRFFRELTVGPDGYPQHRGVHPGNSGVYQLKK